WAIVNQREAPVDFEADSPKNSPNEIETTDIFTAFSSLLAVAVSLSKSRGPLRAHTNVSRQSPNSRGRKRTPQSPRRVQAGDRREIRPAILHHQSGRGCCSDLSLRRMGADRAEAGGAIDLQPDQKEVFEQGELLGPGRGDGWPGPPTDSAAAARLRADQRRGRGQRLPDLPGSAEHGSVPPEDAGREVHA